PRDLSHPSTPTPAGGGPAPAPTTRSTARRVRAAADAGWRWDFGKTPTYPTGKRGALPQDYMRSGQATVRRTSRRRNVRSATFARVHPPSPGSRGVADVRVPVTSWSSETAADPARSRAEDPLARSGHQGPEHAGPVVQRHHLSEYAGVRRR